MGGSPKKKADAEDSQSAENRQEPPAEEAEEGYHRDRRSSNTTEGLRRMTPHGRWPRRLGSIILAALALAAGPGCLSFVHSLDLPPREQMIPGEAIPTPCRNHVHVFLIHGMDPLDLANLAGLTEYIHQLGYIKTHYGQLYHLWEFKKEIRRVHKDDPKARFVLIGFSFGANMVREIANAVKGDGIVIDLLVYLGGNTLENNAETQPGHVLHVVNILAAGCIWNGTTMDRADNRHFTNVWHFGSPTHPKTREMLANELALVAARVPYVESPPPYRPELEQAPQPRRLRPDLGRNPSTELPAEWSFLSPRSAYKEAPARELARPKPSTSAKRIPFSMIEP